MLGGGGEVLILGRVNSISRVYRVDNNDPILACSRYLTFLMVATSSGKDANFFSRL